MREGGELEEGSERDLAFKKNTQYMRDVVKEVIRRRKEGLSKDHVPFLDTLLQSGVPDEQVIQHTCNVVLIKALFCNYYYAILRLLVMHSPS